MQQLSFQENSKETSKKDQKQKKVNQIQITNLKKLEKQRKDFHDQEKKQNTLNKEALFFKVQENHQRAKKHKIKIGQSTQKIITKTVDQQNQYKFQNSSKRKCCNQNQLINQQNLTPENEDCQNAMISQIIQKTITDQPKFQNQNNQIKLTQKNIKIVKDKKQLNVLCNQQMTWQQIFKAAQIKDWKNYKVYCQCQKYFQIQDFKKIASQQIPFFENFLIKFVRNFKVQFQNKKMYFEQGTQISAIKKAFKIKGQKYLFYDQYNNYYQEDQIICNLQIIQKQKQTLERRFNITLIYNNRENSITFKDFVVSKQKIFDLKIKFAFKLNLIPEQQIWKIKNKILQNNDTFQTLKINTNQFNIHVTQKQNLEAYGFNLEKFIPSNFYFDLYIQNDKYFKETIQNSKFPDPIYEESFRIIVLRILFASVKKHRRIKFALDDIKKIVSFSQKGQHAIWQSENPNKNSFFNQHYAIKNILNSLEKQALMEFMRISKNHSPLPILAKNIKGQKVEFFQNHFWIASKSLLISSIGVNQNIKGKTFLLNQIFKTQFQTSDQRHPSSSQSIYIKYNIYRTQEYPVDLIDISNNSSKQWQIKKLLQMSNIIIIHYNHKQSQKLTKFIQQNQIKKKILIIIERDSDENLIVQKQNKRIQIKLKNNTNAQKNFILKISNLVNQCISNENKIINNQFRWNLINYFYQRCNKSKNLTKYYDLLRQIQKQFFNIQNNQTIKLRKALINNIIQINQYGQCELFMSKMRQFSRIQRSQLMSKINHVGEIDNKIDKQQNMQISQQQINKIIEQKIVKLNKQCQQKLVFSLKEKLKLLKNVKIKKKSTELQQVSNQISKINKRLFSIQSFWRAISEEFQKQEDNQQGYFSKPNSISLFKKEVSTSKSFQILNGDKLKIPYSFLKQISDNDKRKMRVIAVLGKQSSGKSTLLNFLFGCDFMASSGRCTSGIYGSIYNIPNYKLESCQSILILDTEGLFGAYRSVKNQRFDNKLALFLFQVCDIIILNLNEDPDSRIQSTLQVAFSSILMTKQKSSNYPHILTILNKNIKTNLSYDQQTDLKVMKSKIQSSCSQMSKYISLENAKSLPYAFYVEKSQNKNSILEKMINVDKVPVDIYYNQIKQVIFLLLNIISKRDESQQSKTFQNILHSMFYNWRLITQCKYLTIHQSLQFKKWDLQLDKQKRKILLEFDGKVKQWKDQLKIQTFKSIYDWKEKMLECFKKQKNKIKQKFNQKQYSQEKKIYIQKGLQQLLRQQVDLEFNQLLNRINDKQIYLDIQNSNHKGMLRIRNKAYQIKEKGTKLTQQQIKNQFEQIWNVQTKEQIEFYQYQKVQQRQFNKIFRHFNDQLKAKNQDCYYIQNEQIFKCRKKIKQDSKLVWTIINQKQFRFIQNHKPPKTNFGKKGNSSFNQNYLNIQKHFFKQQQTVKNFYLNTNKKMKYIINQKLIKQEAFEQFKKSKVMTNLQERLSHKLKSLKIEAQISKIVQACAYHFVFQQKYQVNSYKDQINNMKISVKQISDYKTLINKNNYQEHGLQIVNKSQLHQYQKQELSRIIKRQIPCSQQQNEQINQQSSKIIVENSIRLFIKKLLKQYIKQKQEQASKQVGQLTYKIKSRAISQMEKILNIKLNPNLKGDYDYFHVNQIFNNSEPNYNQDQIDIEKIKNSFSNLIQKKQIKISQKNELKQQLIVRRQKKNEYKVINSKYAKQLNYYKSKNIKKYEQSLKNSKEFKQFLQQKVQFDRFYQKITDKINQISQKRINVQNSIKQIFNLLQAQIKYCNDDLQQISSALSIQAIKNLYFYVFNQLFKLFVTKQHKQSIKKLKQLETQKQIQANIFKTIIDKDSNKINKFQALNFINAYQYHLKLEKEQKNQVLFEQKKIQFFQKVNRRSIQLQIKKIIEKQQEKTIMEIIKEPYQHLKEVYNKKTKQCLDKLKSQYESIILPNIQQLLSTIILLNQKLKKQNTHTYQVDKLFQQRPSQQTMNEIFKTLLIKQKQINHKTLNNKFKLKKGIQFEIQKQLQKNENINFLTKQSYYKISNFMIFLIHLQNELKLLKQKYQKQPKLTKQEQDQFLQKIIFSYCNAKCPFCGKLCDKQTRLEPKYEITSHKIHKSSTGHQFRAISGLKLSEFQSQKQLGSLHVCQNCKQASMLQYNGQQKVWGQVKNDLRHLWCFEKSQQQIYDQAYYQKFWNKNGKLICHWRTLIDKSSMKFVDYVTGIKKMRKKQKQKKHFIIGIDQSYSMKGQKWNNVIKQLKALMRNLSKNPGNLLSIVKFNDEYSIVLKQEIIRRSQFDLQTITISGGGTNFSQALQGMIQCFKTSKQKINIELILISDGQTKYQIEHFFVSTSNEYPIWQIMQLNKLKKQKMNQSLSLNFSTIFINRFLKAKKQTSSLSRICKQLGGQQFNIHKLELIQSIVKEIVNKEIVNKDIG